MPASPRSSRVALSIAVCLAAIGCSSAGTPASPGAASPVAPGGAGASASTAPATTVPGVLRMFDVGPRPSGIVAAGNKLWAEDHAATNTVYAFDPETGAVDATIPLARPCDFAVLDDRMWVADYDAGKLFWLDLTTRTVGGEVGGLRGPCGPQAIGGAIWVAVDDGIARVDPATGAATITALTGGAAFPAAGEGPWAAFFGSGDLVRIDPESGEVAQSISHPGRGAEGPALAVGFDSLWVGDAIGTVYRLDPESGTVQAEIKTSAPARLLVTATSVWLTSYNGGTISRIDPATNTVVFKAYLNGAINGITEGLGGIWVADTSNGRLYLIDPNATGVNS